MLSIESPQITVSSRNSLLGSKLVVRDSFDDDDLSDDADDEVFIQDGRNGVKHDDECGAKRPLMPPRRKNFKSSPFQSNRHRRAVVRALWAPCCYAGLFISIFLIVIGVVVLFANSVLTSPTPWTQQIATELLAPSVLVSRPVWNVSLPHLLSESNLCLYDANADGTLDVALGYSTAVDRNSDPGFICTMYHDRKYPCYGGVVVLDGHSGQTIWQHWTEEGVFAIDCSADLTGDGTKDCLATGKKGLFCAINGRDGSVVWHLPATEQIMGGSESEVFSPHFIADVDGDQIQDIVTSHTGTSALCGHHTGRTGLQGHLLVLSGASGQTLQCLPTPSHAESFTAPQVLVGPDGSSILLVGTGGPHTRGGLHAMPLHPLQGMQLAKSQVLYYSQEKGGLLTPALLVDITGDGTEDVVAAMFDSVVVAFDGISFTMLWNYSIPASELHSPISAGYFNDDNIPDILIRFHMGPGFPKYHYTQTQVLDGRTGKALLKKPLSAAPSADSAPSLSLEGHGNDAFLVWSSGCLAHAASADSKGDTIEIDWDKCDPKLNTTSSDLRLITKHMELPGIHVFHSEETAISQQAKLQTDFTTAKTYIEGHPDFWDGYASLLCTEDSVPDVTEPQQQLQQPLDQQGREQIENVNYQSMPHQVRKHGKIMGHHPYYPPVESADYNDTPRMQDEVYDDQFRRQGRDTDTAGSHKTLPSHISAGMVAPRLNEMDEGIDLIFTSHWSVPKDSILMTFQRCLSTQLTTQRLNSEFLSV
ncbi:hypothetical protein B566_EDAN005244 [Ephemera danica]|nr:hypothetical protein B566_EDAN005244 [Ephemera danica]